MNGKRDTATELFFSPSSLHYLATSNDDDGGGVAGAFMVGIPLPKVCSEYKNKSLQDVP